MCLGNRYYMNRFLNIDILLSMRFIGWWWNCSFRNQLPSFSFWLNFFSSYHYLESMTVSSTHRNPVIQSSVVEEVRCWEGTLLRRYVVEEVRCWGGAVLRRYAFVFNSFSPSRSDMPLWYEIAWELRDIFNALGNIFYSYLWWIYWLFKNRE